MGEGKGSTRSGLTVKCSKYWEFFKKLNIMITILPSAAWREFRGIPPRSGLNSTGHFALISDGSGDERKCFLKLVNLEQSPSLLCEGLGWIFARSAGVRVPKFASIVMVPLDRIRPSVSLPSWLDDHLEYPAWCVEAVDGKTLAEISKWIFLLRRKQCLSSKDTPTLASFDIWADNRDRNYGNVIRTKNGEYIAIDHEVILHDLVVWGMYGIKYEERSLLKEAEKHMQPASFQKFQHDVVSAGGRHGLALQSVVQLAEQYVSTINPAGDSALWQIIYNYLYPRAQAGWMSNFMGMII